MDGSNLGADASRQPAVGSDLHISGGVHGPGIEPQPAVGILFVAYLQRAAGRFESGLTAAHAFARRRLDGAHDIHVVQLAFFDSKRRFRPRAGKEVIEQSP